jgi:hypothetical protein
MPNPSVLQLGNNADPTKNVVLRNNDDGTADIGFGTTSAPVVVQRIGRTPLRNLTSAASITGADINSIITVNGSFTLSHTITAAQAGAGFCYRIKNTGAATVTIDPAGSETIDGATTLLCRAKQEFDVVCDGASWFTLGKQNRVLISSQIVVSSAQVGAVFFTFPPNFDVFEMDCSFILNGSGPPYIYFDSNPTSGWTSATYYEFLYATQASIASSWVQNGSAIYFGVNGTAGNSNAGRVVVYPKVFPHPRFISQVGTLNTDSSELLTMTTGRCTAYNEIATMQIYAGGGGLMIQEGKFALTGIVTS